MRDAAPATLQVVYDFSGYIARRLAEFPNVRLHDFRAVKEITHDLNNYADVIHHSPAVDLKVLSWLAAGDYVVRPRRAGRVAGAAEGAGRGVSGEAVPVVDLILRGAHAGLITQPCAGIGAEYRNPVDGEHHREGDHQHRDAEHGNRGEIAAFVEIVDQH